jgi:hypothetical protein
VKWNAGLLKDSLAASKTPACITNIENSATPPVKKSTSIAKKGFLRKGFLNLRPTSIAPSVPPREVKDVWEKAIEFWERLPLEWALERDKMLAHQKTKGKRKLLNLKSSINYGDVCTPLGVGKAKLT